MPRKNWLWHTAQFGYALNLFTMETLCLIDYLINGDSNGGIIREELRDNQGSLNAVCWNPMTIHFIILFFPRTFNYFILKSLEFMVGGSIFKTFASTLCKRSNFCRFHWWICLDLHPQWNWQFTAVLAQPIEPKGNYSN